MASDKKTVAFIIYFLSVSSLQNSLVQVDTYIIEVTI